MSKGPSPKSISGGVDSSPEQVAEMMRRLQAQATGHPDVAIQWPCQLTADAAALLSRVAAERDEARANAVNKAEALELLSRRFMDVSQDWHTASRQLAEARAALVEMGETASAIRDWLVRGGWAEDFSNWPDGMAAHHRSRIDGMSLAERINALVDKARALLSGETT